MSKTVAGRLCQVLSGLSVALALLGGWMFLVLYWPYRHLFNEEGRYYDADIGVVYHSQSGVIIVPTVLFGILAGVFVLMGHRFLQKRSAQQTNAPASSSAADSKR